LIDEGAFIQAHDPKAVNEVKKYFKEYENKIEYFEHNYDALVNCDAMVLLTEWHLYRQPDFNRIKTLLKNHVIFDGRNQYNPKILDKMGFKYFGVGRITF